MAGGLPQMPISGFSPPAPGSGMVVPSGTRWMTQQVTGAVTSSMTKVTGWPATGIAGSMCIRTVMPLAVFDHVLAEGLRGKVGMGRGGRPGGVGNVATTGGAVVAVRPGGAGGVGTVTVTVGVGATVDVIATVGTARAGHRRTLQLDLVEGTADQLSRHLVDRTDQADPPREDFGVSHAREQRELGDP